jgi:hypothetical protein
MSEPENPGLLSIREWAADLREDAKAADVFAGMAADAGEKRAAAWLRGCSEGLRLAAMRAWRLSPPPELLELTDSPEVPGP